MTSILYAQFCHSQPLDLTTPLPRRANRVEPCVVVQTSVDLHKLPVNNPFQPDGGDGAVDVWHNLQVSHYKLYEQHVQRVSRNPPPPRGHSFSIAQSYGGRLGYNRPMHAVFASREQDVVDSSVVISWFGRLAFRCTKVTFVELGAGESVISRSVHLRHVAFTGATCIYQLLNSQSRATARLWKG